MAAWWRICAPRALGQPAAPTFSAGQGKVYSSHPNDQQLLSRSFRLKCLASLPAGELSWQTAPDSSAEEARSLSLDSELVQQQGLSEQCDLVQHVRTVSTFLDSGTAERLRGTYDEKFANPSGVSGSRFCWDYWHVPGQYTQMRTPAQEYFADQDFQALEAALLEYGKEKLGCVGMTPIWLSYYVDGCEQELHCDNVHGPWAFVLSLTNWTSRSFSGALLGPTAPCDIPYMRPSLTQHFLAPEHIWEGKEVLWGKERIEVSEANTGGETMLLTAGALNHWASHHPETVVERKQLMTLVEPHFNQLTVFDPRVPHGVRQVRGTRDPREARLVLHGWFVEPDMYVEGPLDFDAAADVVNDCMQLFSDVAETLPEATGTLVLRIQVPASGKVDTVTFLTDTLVPRPWECGPVSISQARREQGKGGYETGSDVIREEDVDLEIDMIPESAARKKIKAAAVRCFSCFPYPKQSSDSIITMPLIFE